MNISAYLELKPAPCAVFDTLPERHSRARFVLPTGEAVTWGAFAKSIRQAARFLSSLGLEESGRAAIWAPNSVEWMSAAMAIQAAGLAMVPIYPSSTSEQAAYIIHHSDAKVLFVATHALLVKVFESWVACSQLSWIVSLDPKPLNAEALLEELRAKGKQVPSWHEIEPKLCDWSHAQGLGMALDAEAPAQFDARLAAVSLDALAQIFYTSGTTGNPKGVCLTHRNVSLNARDWIQSNAPLLEEQDIDVLWLPMSHLFGFGEACLGNTLGFTSYLADPVSALDRLAAVRPTVFMSVPSLWEKLAGAVSSEDSAKAKHAKLMQLTGGRLRFCLSGGAGLKREVKELFHACGVLIIEGYGLTECSPTLTLNRPDSFRFDSVGKPFPSVEVKLADDGEILARGPTVFSGYHKDSAATRDAFTADGWFKTGDVGRFTSDGFLQIVDRKKDILVTASGMNVAPANIEVRFRDDPLIAQVVVFGDGQRFLVAGVWLNSHALDPQAIRARVQRRIDAVNQQLASYQTIKKFEIFDSPLTVENGLLTATLKVRRKQIYQQFGKQIEALYQ